MNSAAEIYPTADQVSESLRTTMARTKVPPAPKAVHPAPKRKPQAVERTVVNYVKQKNDWLITELDKRGVPQPAKANKNNLVDALKQNDREAAASEGETIQQESAKNAPKPNGTETRGPRTKTTGPKTGAGVSKTSESKASGRPRNIHTKPRTTIRRLRLLQDSVLNVLDWVLAEDDDRLNPVSTLLIHADEEMKRLMVPHFESPPAASPVERAKSVGAEGPGLRLTGGARYGSVDLSAPSSSGGHGTRSTQRGRFASLGADPLRTSPVARAPKLKASRPNQAGWDPIIGDMFIRGAPSVEGAVVEEEDDDSAEEGESAAGDEDEDPAESDLEDELTANCVEDQTAIEIPSDEESEETSDDNNGQ